MRLRWALRAAGSLGYDLVGVEVLEALKLDQLLQGSGRSGYVRSVACASLFMYAVKLAR